jgi:hypothetical protein
MDSLELQDAIDACLTMGLLFLSRGNKIKTKKVVFPFVLSVVPTLSAAVVF